MRVKSLRDQKPSKSRRRGSVSRQQGSFLKNERGLKKTSLRNVGAKDHRRRTPHPCTVISGFCAWGYKRKESFFEIPTHVTHPDYKHAVNNAAWVSDSCFSGVSSFKVSSRYLSLRKFVSVQFKWVRLPECFSISSGHLGPRGLLEPQICKVWNVKQLNFYYNHHEREEDENWNDQFNVFFSIDDLPRLFFEVSSFWLEMFTV